jgi:hypothetical protein
VRPAYVAFPVLIAVALLIVGVQTVLNAFRYTFNADVVGELASSVTPLALGAALLVGAVAIARGARSGRFVGLAIAALFVLAGVALIVVEAGYLAEGGLGGALAPGIMVVAAVWSMVSGLYGLAIWRARSKFAPSWGRADRWVAAALAVIVVGAVGASFGLEAVRAQAAEQGTQQQVDADALVAAVQLEVRVLDATLAPPPADGTSPAVERLRIELTFRSPQAFGLNTPPVLCLVDEATRLDPAFKPRTFCWGGAGDPLALQQGFADLTMAQGSTTIGLDLDRSTSICAFAAGPWSAEVTIDPARGDSADGEDDDGGVVAPRQPIERYASFVVQGAPAGAFVTPPCTGLE